MRNELSFISSDRETKIHAVEWIPDAEVKAVLQISHGMQEYIKRYDLFAEYLSGKGYLVVGHDHLGHGESVVKGEPRGFFNVEQGNEYLISDIHKLRRHTQEKHPDVPYFVLGHSMGSFLIRQYIMIHGKGLSGAVIMGTGSQAAAALKAAKAMAHVIAQRKGWDGTSSRLDALAFGAYNKGFDNPRTNHDWLTKDESIVDRYLADPMCNYQFTLNGYYQMFRGIEYIQKKENISRIPKDLPLLLVSGSDDPVGHNGKDVENIYSTYLKAGLKTDIKIYPGDRHEILNETDKETVFEDIYSWMEKIRSSEK